MTLFKTKETLVWFALIAFTLLSFYFSDASASLRKPVGSLILLAASLKFSAICYYFMELEEAHVLWRLISGSFLALIVGGMLFLL